MYNCSLLRKLLIIIFLSLAVFFLKGHTQVRAFSVHISIIKKSLNEEYYRKTSTFWIEAVIKNISHQREIITIWTQSGWSWISDNGNIIPATEALQNVSTKITLKPGELYNTKVDLHSIPHKKKPIIFRLGFVPNTKVLHPVLEVLG